MISRWMKDRLGIAPTAGAPRAQSMSVAARQFDRHQRALQALRAAETTQQTAANAVAQHAGALSTTVDDTHALTARARDLRASTDLVREALERAKLLALNAGLEGARLGEPSGRILVTLADEVRTATARGLESQNEHVQLLGQVDRERERLATRLSSACEDVKQLADDLARATEDQAAASAALAELEADLRRTPGADPEAARAVADAAQHARALLGALDALSSRARRNLLLDTLQPLLRRLLRMLDDAAPGKPTSGD